MRRRRRSHEGPHHERWLVSYADFMTLLFALFVVLFASSHHDKMTIQKVSSAVKSGFLELGAFSGSNSTLDVSPFAVPKAGRVPSPTKAGGVGPRPAAGNAGIDVLELQRRLNKASGKTIDSKG